MPDVLHCLRPIIVPTEVRMLQMAVATCLDTVVISDERFFYQATLKLARQLHELGCRVVDPT